MNTNALVTLDYVVKSYLNRKGINSSADYHRFKQILIEGLTDLNLFHTTYYSEYIGKVNAVNQLSLPIDFVNWKMVAVVLNGKYWPLDYNKELVSEPDNLATTPVFTEHLSSPPVEGNGYTRLRRNRMGTFKVNKEKRVITFEGDLKDYDIYVHYVSSGIPLSGTVYVSRDLVTVLRDYLDWQLKYNDDSVPLNSKIIAENTFGRSLMKYIDNTEPVTIKELYNAFNAGRQQGVHQ